MSAPHFGHFTPAAAEGIRVSDVFQEVQEEYRRQQLAELWKKYRIPAIGGAVALVLAVAGYQGWTYWRGEQALASSRAFDAGVKQLDADNKAAADQFAKLSTKAVGGYAMLSRFHEAATRGQAGEVEKALAIYDDIARGTSDPLFSGLATLRAALLTVEKASLAETKKRLDPLIAGTGPWRAGSLELLAYATWRAGKDEDALKIYGEILALPDAPEKLKRRATEMKALIEGGLTFQGLNKITMPVVRGPSLLPPGFEPPKADAPGSLLGPADIPELPNPLQPAPETAPTSPSP